MVFFSTCRISSPKLCGSVIIIARKQQVCAVTVAHRSISGKAMREGLPPVNKPAPFPYKEKRYNFFRALFDPTPNRLDENSKLIVVEGPPAAGKGLLAKELAEELGMAYFPSPTVAESYINDYGYDLRQLDPKLPKSCQSYDENDFLKDPMRLNGSKAGRFQLAKLGYRYKRHLEALAHILNTGQGVVMDRSPYSDLVYITAMAEAGIISKNVYNYYHSVRNNALFALWRPHLVIYLDVPVAETRANIEARNRPYEKDSKVATPEYLQVLIDSYKKDYLKDISTHAEVLVYDWRKPADTEIVVEDIERINFDQYGVYDTKMKDWRCYDKWDWNNKRQVFTHSQHYLLGHLNVPPIRCPEISFDGADVKIHEAVMEEAPGNGFAKGFNAEMGDKGILFKLS
uniref:NADH dehydrogenase [ubiquinone] 1 alpha subcomplex subunit 10, mitochondrial n=1 Tax=Daphnia dolichocephala TaxID=2282166 RepID=A0A4Y7M3H7_9CRUS|nr:EOG090X05NZ [Daphnia dolichocephala]